MIYQCPSSRARGRACPHGLRDTIAASRGRTPWHRPKKGRYYTCRTTARGSSMTSSLIAEPEDSGWVEDMAWAEPEYSRQRVNEAGQRLIEPAYDGDDFAQNFMDRVREFDEALVVINNWRASHHYPLNTFQVNLRRTSRRIDEEALVAQRIKRLSSISHKLERFPNMKLSQMQDIGGCRAVVSTVAHVHALYDAYKKSNIKHELSTVDDYIESPRDSGYRGIHLIYKYYSDKSSKGHYILDTTKNPARLSVTLGESQCPHYPHRTSMTPKRPANI